MTNNKTIGGQPNLRPKLSHMAIGAVIILAILILHVKFNQQQQQQQQQRTGHTTDDG